MATKPAALDVQEKMVEARTRRGHLEKQRIDLQGELQDMEQRARALRKQFASGDATAEAALDHLEKRMRDARRREDGLTELISEADSTFIALKREVDELTGAREQERRRQEFNRKCADATAAVDHVCSLHRALTQALGEVSFIERELRDGWGIQGAQVVEKLITIPLVNPAYELMEIEKWRAPVPSLRARSFEVFALVPPGWKNPVLNGSNGNGKAKS